VKLFLKFKIIIFFILFNCEITFAIIWRKKSFFLFFKNSRKKSKKCR
jgi:hypothetical protein